jgi:hypothetical protein
MLAVATCHSYPVRCPFSHYPKIAGFACNLFLTADLAARHPDCVVAVCRDPADFDAGVSLEGLAMKGKANSFFGRRRGRGRPAMTAALLPVAMIAALCVWAFGPPRSAGGQSLGDAAPAATAQQATPVNAAPAPTGAETNSTPAAQATASPEAVPVNGLKISSQSWRRGGLGSKALVTFTLRNDNDYAVKDIEIACVFSRRDGSHLTDRKRILPDMVNMKSRRTFERLHIGFVNIYANKAKCTPIAASRA